MHHLAIVSLLTFTVAACDAAAPAEAPDAATPAAEVPTTSDALFAFLQEDGYRDFVAEPAIHPSAGPHSDGGVRTFVNPALAASLAAGAGAHPRGAAAVKELYASDGQTLAGWAVTVKLADDSDDGRGWFWYEVFSTTDGTRPIASGAGVSLCTSCHRDGDDFVFTALR